MSADSRQEGAESALQRIERDIDIVLPILRRRTYGIGLVTGATIGGAGAFLGAPLLGIALSVFAGMAIGRLYFHAATRAVRRDIAAWQEQYGESATAIAPEKGRSPAVSALLKEVLAG